MDPETQKQLGGVEKRMYILGALQLHAVAVVQREGSLYKGVEMLWFALS
jgi:hypothetical protein